MTLLLASFVGSFLACAVAITLALWLVGYLTDDESLDALMESLDYVPARRPALTQHVFDKIYTPWRGSSATIVGDWDAYAAGFRAAEAFHNVKESTK